MLPLTYDLGLHGDGHAAHGEEREDGLVEPLVLEEVAREVNGEEVFLGAHAGNVPERHVGFADDKLTLGKHDSVHTCRRADVVTKGRGVTSTGRMQD